MKDFKRRRERLNEVKSVEKEAHVLRRTNPFEENHRKQRYVK